MIDQLKDWLKIGWVKKEVYETEEVTEKTEYGEKVEYKLMKVWKHPRTGEEKEEQLLRSVKWEFYDDTE